MGFPFSMNFEVKKAPRGKICLENPRKELLGFVIFLNPRGFSLLEIKNKTLRKKPRGFLNLEGMFGQRGYFVLDVCSLKEALEFLYN